MTSFVLVHGAFRGGWAWRRVRPHLIAAGHDVHAPSLLGAGEHAGLIDAVTGLEVWVDQVARLIELEDLYDVALVGHSQGGLVTTAVAARIPERIGHLVHLDAAVPAPGERAVDLHPGGAPDPLPPRAAVVPAPAPASDLDASAAAWLAERTTATPVAVALDPVPAAPDGVPEHFVFCDATPPGYPATAVRARLDAERRDYRLLESGHDAPLTAPAQVARLLIDVTTAVPSSRERSPR
ncbi:alpha/beta hydrolase [Nocardioides sp. GY 10113]|uniref:alpha/beta fold hydrolase n=1 Tax=Nocardioides sp. GY 10113 TaxID=2569761 RepID=UPI0010A84681|nr:alpha/beta fold hydrolase [Nocardioides sp. GY 10113]TIC88059.1 alpha/beta hydrolase [Nocardioides sp. GY 10113]